MPVLYLAQVVLLDLVEDVQQVLRREADCDALLLSIGYFVVAFCQEHGLLLLFLAVRPPCGITEV